MENWHSITGADLLVQPPALPCHERMVLQLQGRLGLVKSVLRLLLPHKMATSSNINTYLLSFDLVHALQGVHGTGLLVDHLVHLADCAFSKLLPDLEVRGSLQRSSERVQTW